MGYNLARHYLNCWACGRHRLIETLMELLDMEFQVAARLLRQVDREDYVPEQKRRRGKLVLPKGLRSDFPTLHRQYLEGRHLKPARLAKLWDIKSIQHHSTLKWRIFIPIFQDGEMVSWTTRSVIDNEKLRYVSASEDEEAVDHKTLLYGLDYCRHAIIITEGPFDVWRIGPGAVCTFGTTFNDAQVWLASRFAIRAVCYDKEPAAQERARELCSRLEVFPGDTFNVQLKAKDPGSAGMEEIRQLRQTFLEA